MIVAAPRILNSYQFVSDFPQPNRAECDCACPDNDIKFSVLRTAFTDKQLLYQSTLYTQNLLANYFLMFNPLGNSGVSVVNTQAYTLWQQFTTPCRLTDLNLSLTQEERACVVEMIELGLLKLSSAIPQKQQGTPQTLSAWLHVTNECNLRCDYCYVSKSSDQMSEATGFAAIDAIIRSAMAGNFRRVKLKFAGGEAMLNLKLVFALHTYAVAKTTDAGLGLETVILSNGVAIGERAITEFCQRGIYVMISLDGIGETHDAQRKFANGKGSFAYTQRTLDRLLVKGIKPFISITVTDRNADSLADVVAYVLDRELPFNLNFFRDNDCAASYADLQLHEDHLIAALRQAFAVIEQKLPAYSLLGALVDRAQFDQPHNKTCGVGESYLVVDHHGQIAKCHMEIEKTITDVFASDPLSLIRADQIGIQNLAVEEKEGCRECEWRYWCAGGCPALTYRMTGRYDIKSPYCRVYKAIYPDLLRLEGFRLLKLSNLLPTS